MNALTGLAFGLAALALQGCSKSSNDDAGALDATPVVTEAASVAPAADNTDTLDGSKLASFTGSAVAGEKVFMACRTCHSTEAGKNMTGPSLHGLQGHKSGQIPGYKYSEANKASGIAWTNEKLFQYLESPQRVVPGTKMSYTGVKDPQQRADLVAYLDTLK
ncbi:MAG: cytochrome c family protein [Sphingomonadales bacterium]